MTFGLSRRLAAEALGTGLLVAAVVGSGIMAERLAGGNVAIALLGNTLPTGAILVVLLLALGPVSGAHFNPAVSLVMVLTGALPRREVAAYASAQVIGGCLGTLVAHAMFALPLLQLAGTTRTGPALWFAEFVATFGLLLTVLLVARFQVEAVPVARSLTDTFAGIAPGHVLPFVAAQLAGALAGLALSGWLLRPDPAEARSADTDAVGTVAT